MLIEIIDSDTGELLDTAKTFTEADGKLLFFQRTWHRPCHLRQSDPFVVPMPAAPPLHKRKGFLARFWKG